jgi:DUF4097 and DUF4098 domain-containing protein YvlB
MRVDNHQGSVTVRSWDRSEMRVTAVHANRIRVRIRRTETGIRIEGEARQGPAHGIDYEITVPRAWGVSIDGVYCEVQLQDLDGDVTVDNVQGDIIVRGGRGRFDLESVEGSIIVSGVRGRVNAEAVNQSIRVSDVTGNVIADAVNGGIQLTGIQADSVDAESVNGGIQYDGALRDAGRYRFSTHNGAVRVAVPAGTNANVTVATHSGNVETDFPVHISQAIGNGRLTFVIGNGGARLSIESFAGNIRLYRPGALNR